MFAPNIELQHKASGRAIQGVEAYQRVFMALRFLRNSTMTADEVTYRLVVSGLKIRVRWQAKLWIHDPLAALPGVFGSGEPPIVIVDGVSIYDVNETGYIYRHTLDNLEITPSAVQDTLGWAFAAWSKLETPAVALSPFTTRLYQSLDHVFPATAGSSSGHTPSTELPARAFFDAGGRVQLRPTSSKSRLVGPPRATQDSTLPAQDETPMERAARERAEDAAAAKRREEAMRAAERPQGTASLLATFRSKLLSGPQTCESNYDCERPLVCCDLLVARVCCSSGAMIGAPKAGLAPQRVAIPVPVDADPTERGGGRGGIYGRGNGYPTPP